MNILSTRGSVSSERRVSGKYVHFKLILLAAPVDTCLFRSRFLFDVRYSLSLLGKGDIWLSRTRVGCVLPGCRGKLRILSRGESSSRPQTEVQNTPFTYLFYNHRFRSSFVTNTLSYSWGGRTKCWGDSGLHLCKGSFVYSFLFLSSGFKENITLTRIVTWFI